MNQRFLICWIIFIYAKCSAEDHKIPANKSFDSCTGDLCSEDYDINTEKSVTHELQEFDVKNFSNSPFSANNLNKKESYYITASEHPSTEKKSGFTEDFERKTKKKLQLLLDPTENINLAPQTEELYNVTDVTEIIEFSESNISNVTIQPNITKTTVTTTTSNTSNAQTPFEASNTSLLNSKNNKNFCFCDLQINQCDINCCCDEDCSSFHFKVFTKCDDNNIAYDSKYCYNTNFIFGNSTSLKIVQSSKGLFCIVRENVNVERNYQTIKLFSTLEMFNKNLQNNSYAFSYKTEEKSEYINNEYKAGSLVWSFQNGELMPFKICHSSVGFLCNSKINIKYLFDQVKSCFYQEKPNTQCLNTRIGKVLNNLKGIKIISNPSFLNKSQLLNSSKICSNNLCIGVNSYLCQLTETVPECKFLELSKQLPDISCWSTLTHIQYQIWHNGSEGISKVDAYLWIKNLPKISDEFLNPLTTEIRFIWLGSPKKVFRKSGSPGYITGKPILAGKKVYSPVNGNTKKKEAIELSSNPKDWLSVLGSDRGLCSSEKRIPINFKENSHYMCSLKLGVDSFSKEKCIELQNKIFKLLIGNDVINETKENYFNKFVATYGNSKIEDTESWVQVLIDSFPIVSSQVYFKSNHHYLMCKNIITDLYIDVVHSNTGSFLAPQAKILGVALQFGKYQDLTYFCDSSGCDNTSLQYFKLSSTVNFIDVTKPAVDAFAEPLSLEIKLPHDFFYPFFSKGYKPQFLSKFLLILFFKTFVITTFVV